ncbi:MAG TPA: CAP domain-containing protein [Coleofasciculaceae cyanobacterium]
MYMPSSLGGRSLGQTTPISSNRTLTDRVSQGNPIDLFSFNLSDRTGLTLKCKSSGLGTQVQLIQDSNQNGVIDKGETLKRFAARSNKIGTMRFSDLAAGTYFVQVSAIRQSGSRYRLSLSGSLGTAVTPSGTTASSGFRQRVIELTNSYRLKNGLAALTENRKLDAVAQAYSQTMATQDFLAHQGLDGSQPWDRMAAAGYQWSRAAENIAAGQSTPEEVVQGWIDSPGHRANLLDPKLKEIGVGYFFLSQDTGNVNYNSYWTQDFGTPA